VKQNNILELPKLNSENLENIFNVYQDEQGLFYYNLYQSIVFPQDLPLNLFTTYTIIYGDTWPFISFKTLESPNLWWILMLANNIINPLLAPEVGSKIKVPIQSVVDAILNKVK
jgi:hypothetical protein